MSKKIANKAFQGLIRDIMNDIVENGYSYEDEPVFEDIVRTANTVLETMTPSDLLHYLSFLILLDINHPQSKYICDKSAYTKAYVIRYVLDSSYNNDGEKLYSNIFGEIFNNR